MYLQWCVVIVMCGVLVSGKGNGYRDSMLNRGVTYIHHEKGPNSELYVENQVSFIDEPKQNHTGAGGSKKGCTIEGGKQVKVNEQVDLPNQCKLNKCAGNNEWTTAPCGYLGVPEGWSSTPEDTSATAKYPSCCAHLIPPMDIVPDVLDSQPGTEYLAVSYGPSTVNVGNMLTPTQVKDEPTINFEEWADPKSYYLLVMVDPDAPSRQNPSEREFLHWMVGNIRGKNVRSGEKIVEYVGAGPPQRTGPHRYFFLLFKQPRKLTFSEEKLNKNTVGWRSRFSSRNFAKKYNLNVPESVNVFQAQYDNYVPEIQKQLGLGGNLGNQGGNFQGRPNQGQLNSQYGGNPNYGQQGGFNPSSQEGGYNQWQQPNGYNPPNYGQPGQPPQNYALPGQPPQNYALPGQPPQNYGTQSLVTIKPNYYLQKAQAERG